MAPWHRYMWSLLVLSFGYFQIQAEWVQGNCTVLINECKMDGDECKWWLPTCKIHPEIECQPGEKEPLCCTADECGGAFGAFVVVTFQEEVGTWRNWTVYNSVLATPLSTIEEVNQFLNKFRQGETYPCWHELPGYTQTFLIPDHICNEHGTYSLTLKKCECDLYHEGEYCETYKDNFNTPENLRIRNYYIAANEVIWDYAPSGMDLISNNLLNATIRPSHNPMMWTSKGPKRIGKQYKKAIFQEYTDSTFTTLKPREKKWEHAGILGPVIRGEVGDTLRIVFKNNATKTYSIHPHGVLYQKDSEGAGYADRVRGNGNRVSPGQIYIYQWEIPERAGPGPNDPSSIVWPYHSHVDEAEDTNSGLVGPIIITRTGYSRNIGDRTPKDIDKEFIVFLTIFDENQSWYLIDNMKTITPTLTEAQTKELMMNVDFQNSNMKYAINGYLYGNGGNFTMKVNETVRWYLFSMGTQTDLHGTHWHGNTLLYQGSRVDSVDLMPGMAKTVDMIPDAPGLWLFHCHSNHHIHGGMMELYTVLECGADEKCEARVYDDTVSDYSVVEVLSYFPLYMVAVVGSIVILFALAATRYWYTRRKSKQSKKSKPYDKLHEEL